jgi:hypothetical protein
LPPILPAALCTYTAPSAIFEFQRRKLLYL